jgi:DNA-binding GntR family transcriptional regulator
MPSRTEVRKLLIDLFEEQALVIGGLVAVQRPDDEFVHRLFKSLEVIRGRFLRRLGDRPPGEGGAAALRPTPVRPHPAIEQFLHSLRRV